MAILVVSEVADWTAEQDATLVKALNLDGSPPVGFRIRMAGPTAHGWRIASLWDSEADFERYRNERLVPALTGAGRSLPALEIWPIETVDTVWEL